MSFNKVRSALAFLCLVSTFFFPWWIALACALALSVRYRAWEIVPIGIIFDLLWLPGLSVSLTGLPLATLTALLLLIIFEPLRRELLTSSSFLQ